MCVNNVYHVCPLSCPLTLDTRMKKYMYLGAAVLLTSLPSFVFYFNLNQRVKYKITLCVFHGPLKRHGLSHRLLCQTGRYICYCLTLKPCSKCRAIKRLSYCGPGVACLHVRRRVAGCCPLHSPVRRQAQSIQSPQPHLHPPC